MAKINQQARIIEYLKQFGSITDREAMEHLGIGRLSARIYDLKKDGIKIKSEMIPVKNRFGETCYVARYRFDE